MNDGQFQPHTGSSFKDVSIGASGILKPDAAAAVTVSGNWANSGTFTSGTGSVEFNGGTTQTINAGGTANDAKDFTDVTISGSTLQLTGSALEVDGTLTINATKTVDLNGLGLTLGTLENGGTVLLEGGEAVAITTMDTNTGLFKYDGWTVTIDNIAAAGGPSYYGLEFDEAGAANPTYTLPDAAVHVYGDLTITDGTLAMDNDKNLTVDDDFTIAASQAFTKSASGSLTLSADLDNASTYTDSTGSQNLGIVQIGNDGSGTVTLASDLVADGVTVIASDVFDLDGYEMDIGTGGITINGTLDAGTGSEAGDTNSTINNAGDWTTAVASTFTKTGSTVVMDGTSGTIDVTSNGKIFNHLTLNDNAGTATFEIKDALNVDGTFLITDGILDIGTDNPTVNTAGDVTIGVGSSITVTGRTANWTFDGTTELNDNTWEQDFEDVVVNGTSLTIPLYMKVETMTVSSGTLTLGGDASFVIDGTGEPFSVNDTFEAGVGSYFWYSPAVANPTTIETTNVAYSTLYLDDSGSGGSVTFTPEGNTLTVGLHLNLVGGTLVASTKTVDVGGELWIDGAVTVSTGTINVSGNWLTIGATGSITFTDAGSLNFSGTNFSLASVDSFVKGSSTVTFDRDNAIGTVYVDIAGFNTPGTLALNNFTYDASGNTNAATIQIDNADTVTVAGALTLKGNSTNRLTVTSDDGSNTVDFDLLAGGKQTVDYLTVTRVDSATGLEMIPGNTTAPDCTSTVNWTCGGAGTYVWDGAVDSNWSTALNWDVGRSPVGDTGAIVTITDGVNPAVAGAAISVADLTINSGTNGKLTLGGYDLTVSGTFANNGTLVLQGGETVSAPTNGDGSKVEFVGDGTGAATTHTITRSEERRVGKEWRSRW